MIHKFTIRTKHDGYVTREYIYTSVQHARNLADSLWNEGFYSEASQYDKQKKPFWDFVSSSLLDCPALPRKARGKLTSKDRRQLDDNKEVSILVCLY